MIPIANGAAVNDHVAKYDQSRNPTTFAETLRLSKWRENDRLGELTTRSVVVKRELDRGGVAGVAVGVVFAVLLVALCLYPVVVGRIKRRRHRARHSFDVEVGMIQSSGAADEPPGAQRRLSSQESFKPDGDVSRGGFNGRMNKELGWTAQDGTAQPDLEGQAQQERGVRINTAFQMPPFQSYDGEYMPQEIGDAHNGILNGTSADYYSPSIPSEAFGMVTTDEILPPTKQSVSRGSSLKYNVMHLFGRKSTRTQTSTSPSLTQSDNYSTPAGQATPQNQDTSLQRIITDEITTESPVQMSAPVGEMLPPPHPPPTSTLQPSATIIPSSENEPVKETTPSRSPPPENKFTMSPSPPANPAPGTVNPMDIMPASTTTEMWHRTEHQLYMSYNQPSPSPGTTPMPESTSPAETNQMASPPTQVYAHPQPTPRIQSPTPGFQNAGLKFEKVEEDDVAMADIPSLNHLSPMPEHENYARHPSYPSDKSTPLPGPASTNASTLNTPNTQLDSPSPKSEGLSDYRPSALPNSATNPSSKTGSYPCDEPGCNQVFDQPHKLKHHQRYHTKDHKCVYPGCGKGFGTKTHLQRHINDRHEKKKKYHCAIPGCDYSKQGGKGFPRKDNWKRHMTKIHQVDQQHLPEPVEADQEMAAYPPNSNRTFVTNPLVESSLPRVGRKRA